jgi:hypothetical protein
MAMYNTALLAQENIDLRTAIDLQERKKKRSRKPILNENGSLDVEEAIRLLQQSHQPDATSTPASTEASLQRKRAPPRRSDYRQISHIRDPCPSRRI